MEPRSAETTAAESSYLIVVARDQPDVYVHLLEAFFGDRKVDVFMDRRKDDSRNPPTVNERLRTHGAAVLRKQSAANGRGGVLGR